MSLDQLINRMSHLLYGTLLTERGGVWVCCGDIALSGSYEALSFLHGIIIIIIYLCNLSPEKGTQGDSIIICFSCGLSHNKGAHSRRNSGMRSTTTTHLAISFHVDTLRHIHTLFSHCILS